MDLTDAIKQHAQDKMQGLEKFLKNPDAVECAIEVGKTSAHHQKGPIYFCEVHLVIPGEENIRAREVTQDLYVSIDIVRKELQRQLVDAKEKRIERERQNKG